MGTHNICFRREIRKILCGYPLLSVAMAYRGSAGPGLIQSIKELPTRHTTSHLLTGGQNLSSDINN